jgi:membrane protease YdiL (CAAX protease family)
MEDEAPPVPPPSDAPASDAPASEPVVQITCPNCSKKFPSRFKFCPGCGRSRAELDDYKEQKRQLAGAAREATSSWQRVSKMATFYTILLVFNYLASYVLPQEQIWGMLVADSVLVIVSLIWWADSSGALKGKLAAVRPLLLPAMPLAAVGTFLIANGNNWVVLNLLGLGELFQRRHGTEAFFELAMPLPGLIVSICLVPGIFEEVFFRGLAQGTLETMMTRREALWVQAVIFAIAHVNPLGFFTYLVLLGLALGWLRNRTGSLLPGMVLHFSHNLLCVLDDRYNLLGQ